MKGVVFEELPMDSLAAVHYERFRDERGYFSETFRWTQIFGERALGTEQVQILQGNESFSHAGTVRGLHFQWNPFMGKLVRTIAGHMIDLVLDIRKGSDTYGHVIAYDMPADPDAVRDTWIWVPPGFAHGNLFLDDTTIEYLCTGEYNGECEAGISPLAADLDWSLCEPDLRATFRRVTEGNGLIISQKDRTGMSLSEWTTDSRSENFIFQGNANG